MKALPPRVVIGTITILQFSLIPPVQPSIHPSSLPSPPFVLLLVRLFFCSSVSLSLRPSLSVRLFVYSLVHVLNDCQTFLRVVDSYIDCEQSLLCSKIREVRTQSGSHEPREASCCSSSDARATRGLRLRNSPLFVSFLSLERDCPRFTQLILSPG